MKKIKLVLSGSGTRFPVFVGAISRLLEEGYEIEEVCGTSGGAIIAAGLSLGFDGKQLSDLCLNILPKINELIDPSLWTFLWKWGLIKGDKIEKEFMKQTLGATFNETKIPLKVITVNYDKANSENPYHTFCSKDTPGMCIAKAVRASMSIPLVFEPVKINGDRHIDGGVGANFPLDIFGEETNNVIGLHMNPENPSMEKNDASGIAGLGRYILDIVDFFIATATQEDIEDAVNAKVINLSTDMGGLNFALTEADVSKMIEQGYTTTNKWLENI